MRNIGIGVERMSKNTVLMIGLLLVLAIGIFDYLTGYWLAFYPFYLLPLIFVVWYAGIARGLILSLVSAVTWIVADCLARKSYPNILIPIWNFTIRLTIFTFMAYLMWRISATQARNRELAEFIVHDLRVPLAHISLGIRNLLEIENQGLSNAQKEIISTCRHSSDRMSSLITSILYLARLEKKKMRIRAEEVNLGRLLKETLDQMCPLAKEKEIRLREEFSTGIETIFTDQDLLYRILVNLIMNAIKAGPAGSVVTIGVTEQEKRSVVFSVKDSGQGIPRHMTGKIFNSSVQVEAREAGVLSGSIGLGLIFCRLAVEELGGSISIESEEGKGTEVIFRLPLRSKDSYPASPTTRP